MVSEEGPLYPHRAKCAGMPRGRPAKKPRYTEPETDSESATSADALGLEHISEESASEEETERVHNQPVKKAAKSVKKTAKKPAKEQSLGAPTDKDTESESESESEDGQDSSASEDEMVTAAIEDDASESEAEDRIKVPEELRPLLRDLANVLNFIARAKKEGIDPEDPEAVGEACERWRFEGLTPEDVAREKSEIVMKKLLEISVAKLCELIPKAKKLQVDLRESGSITLTGRDVRPDGPDADDYEKYKGLPLSEWPLDRFFGADA
ncbi:Uu.00g012220.m01.CDS01 [Anthostomella pinea]|uniref:Uu.00g012220.m01.CDS01 n=1 Tax=Anthostomella pinea TaxID=933095 RepID=A0AAI8VXW6_9PEZI|nr:Uu.00g012220.m01.CDS01 [Anthostomella pinea]